MSKQLYKLYNNEFELAFDPEAKGHRYIVNGVPVPGVTTILQTLNKPALIQWSANQAVLSVKDNGQLSKDGKTLTIASDKLEEAKTAYAKARDKAGDVGTIVHAFIETYPQKKVYPETEPAKGMCETLAKWYDENVQRSIEAEVPVYSPTYGYAGKPDDVVMIDNKVVLVDFKTTSGIYDEAFIQLGAYAFALREEGRVNVEDVAVVNITKQNKLQVKFLSEKFLPVSTVENAFIQTLNLYNSIRTLKNGS